MKHILLALVTSLLIMVGGKDLRVVVFTPDPIMHCENCETKIKGNMRFEKGVVKIETDREKQTVTITYDAFKTNVENLQAAMKKIGRETTVVSDKKLETKSPKSKK